MLKVLGQTVEPHHIGDDVMPRRHPEAPQQARAKPQTQHQEAASGPPPLTDAAANPAASTASTATLATIAATTTATLAAPAKAPAAAPAIADRPSTTTAATAASDPAAPSATTAAAVASETSLLGPTTTQHLTALPPPLPPLHPCVAHRDATRARCFQQVFLVWLQHVAAQVEIESNLCKHCIIW